MTACRQALGFEIRKCEGVGWMKYLSVRRIIQGVLENDR
jgi:hypothetical protein